MSRRISLAAAVVLTAAAALPSGSAGQATSKSGIDVDPQAYADLWYEIARAPAPFEARCAGGATAFYEVVGPSTLRVVNRCDLPNGQMARVEGTATARNEDLNALEVDFPGSPDSGVNYLVEGLGPLVDGRYRWSAVRSPEGYASILARTPPPAG